MSIPVSVTIKNGVLPDEPGVYFHKNAKGDILYIGKATSLKQRVQSYFHKAHNGRIAELVSNIRSIDYIETPTVLEALVLEAHQIKKHKPPYNILLRDDKSFLYVCITNELYPKPLLIRGHDLASYGIKPFETTLSPQAKKRFIAVYGPFPSGGALKKALDTIRKFIPWSTCEPPEVKRPRPCFNVHLKRCPGVCTGAISAQDYKLIIKDLRDFLEGKKERVVRRLKSAMERASVERAYEEASVYRDQLFAIEHIRDVALISKDDIELPFETPKSQAIDINGRIEAYDISHLSGTGQVGVMTVFEHGTPAKSLYRKFRIKTVDGSNDVASMQEVIRRRIRRAEQGEKHWELPQLMIIDGGVPQVNAVNAVLKELGITLPIIGIAKGVDRKQDRLIFDRANPDLVNIAQRGKQLFQQVRDEAHRFAVQYQRSLRRKPLAHRKKSSAR